MTVLSNHADFDDMGDVVDDFAEEIAIQRRAAGTFDDNGRFTKAADSDLIAAMGTVTPATPADLERLPEGRKTTRVMRVLTRTECLMEPQADVIEWNGLSWEVGHVQPWLGAFFDVLMIEKSIQ